MLTLLIENFVKTIFIQANKNTRNLMIKVIVLQQAEEGRKMFFNNKLKQFSLNTYSFED